MDSVLKTWSFPALRDLRWAWPVPHCGKFFADIWRRAERGKKIEEAQRLYFKNFKMLLKTLTSGRRVLLKILRETDPLSIRTLTNEPGRDYKNVHTDVRRLEYIGLIGRTEDGKMEVPWDVVEARLMPAASPEFSPGK